MTDKNTHTWSRLPKNKIVSPNGANDTCVCVNAPVFVRRQRVATTAASGGKKGKNSMHTAKLYSADPNIETETAYMARVSTKQHARGLKRFFELRLAEKHWSIFEMHSIRMQVVTTLAVQAQMTRHTSMRFQVRSLRYSNAAQLRQRTLKYVNSPRFVVTEQPTSAFEPKPDADYNTHLATRVAMTRHVNTVFDWYDALVKQGVSYETARGVLPMCVVTDLYASGTVRSWLHYCAVRNTPHAQTDHRLVAQDCQAVLRDIIPNIYEAAIKAGILNPLESDER